MVRCFLSLSHFLVVEDYELSKIEKVCVRLLFELMTLVSTHHVTKSPDLSQQVEIDYEL